MFEAIRKHSRIVMIVLFLLIIPSFVLFGIDGYRRSMETSAAVATVAGESVTQGEWDQAHRFNVERLRAQAPNADAKLLDSPTARYVSLERLVRERVLRTVADQQHLAPSNTRLARVLAEDPVIGAMRTADGKVDMALYRETLARQGLTPQQYEAQVRNELALRQVAEAVPGTAFVIPAQARAALDAIHEQRAIQVLDFPAKDYVGQVHLSDDALRTYYQQHAAQFRVPERADIEYLVLDAETIARGITIDDAALQKYYEASQSRLGRPEERRASHILIESPKTASADDRAKARQRAEALLAEVRRAPTTFADVARKQSQDPGSAPAGGDLGFFARGAMVKPFEDAVFAMKPGQIGDVVESDFGYHVVRLDDVRAATVKPLAEVRDELLADLRRQQAQARFAQEAEAFTNGVYEQADSLQPTAEKLHLQIQRASGVTRTPREGATGALASARLLEALFSPEAVAQKRNTQAVETGPQQLAAARIVAHHPAETPAFDTVREQVRARATQERAVALAREAGEARLAALRANPSAVALPAAVVISRGEARGLPQAVVDAALRMPATPLPAHTGVDLGSTGFAVVRLARLEAPARPPEEQAAQERAGLQRALAAAEAAAYYETLKERLKVRVKADRPPAAASAAQSPSAPG